MTLSEALCSQHRHILWGKLSSVGEKKDQNEFLEQHEMEFPNTLYPAASYQEGQEATQRGH